MCVEPGEVMSSPALREASARMLKVTGGEWCRDDRIPMASGEDDSTTFLAWYFRVFPYRQKIGIYVIAVMNKERRESSKKKRKAPLWLVDPPHEMKALHAGTTGGPTSGAVKTVAASTAMPPTVALVSMAIGTPRLAGLDRTRHQGVLRWVRLTQ